ncbi:hypothetical protein [Halopenitus persicus]|uniref:hypothetical protein n=1 Tax=Halopenitus persicus TaxID=1048396 RepID=UPI001160D008|nr:hypothetical protein [Halopenitus persicus]
MKKSRPRKKRMILSPIGTAGINIDVRIEPAPMATEAAVPDTSGFPAIVPRQYLFASVLYSDYYVSPNLFLVAPNIGVTRFDYDRG